MKKIAVVFLTILLVCIFCTPSLGDTDAINRVRNAYKICWAGGEFVALQDSEHQPIKLIRLSDGKELMDHISSISSTGNYACVDGMWMISSDGSITLLKNAFDPDEMPVMGRYGIFVGISEGKLCTYHPSTDTFTTLWSYPDDYYNNTYITEVYTDDQGHIFVLNTENGVAQIFQSDGKVVLEKGYIHLEYNCDYSYFTNGYLIGSDKDSSVVLSAYNGEVLARFDYIWEPYDGERQVYLDNTASIGDNDTGAGSMIVGLDGTILKKLPDGQFFRERFECYEPAPVYYFDGKDVSGVYNVLTDRTYLYEETETDTFIDGIITCIETGEHFKHNSLLDNYHSVETGKTYNTFDEFINEGDLIPERMEKYRPVNQRVPWFEHTEKGYWMVIDADGRIMGNKYWKNLPWLQFGDGVGGGYPFGQLSVCAVMDMNDLYGVMNIQGELVVPTEYEKVEYLESFSDNIWEKGYCIAAYKNGQWYLFNSTGEDVLVH